MKAWRAGAADRVPVRILVPAMVGLVGLISGCAHYSPRARADEMPTLSDAYLYGRLLIDAPKVPLGMDGHQTMGFVIRCDDGGEHVLRFDREDPIVVVKIRPATCSWSEIVYSDADGVVRSRKPAPPDVFKDIVLEGGYSYYLGDFHAQLRTSMDGIRPRTDWHIKAIPDNYEYTTEDMLEAYPKLKALPTENRMILRKHRGPRGVPRPIGVDGSIAMAGRDVDQPWAPSARARASQSPSAPTMSPWLNEQLSSVKSAALSSWLSRRSSTSR